MVMLFDELHTPMSCQEGTKEIRVGSLERSESNRRSRGISAEDILSHYNENLQKLRRESMGRRSDLSQGHAQRLVSISLMSEDRLDFCSHDAVEHTFSTMSRDELIAFCIQVHRMLFPMPLEYTPGTTRDSITTTAASMLLRSFDAIREESCRCTEGKLQEPKLIPSLMLPRPPPTPQSEFLRQLRTLDVPTSPGLGSAVVVRSDLKKGCKNGKKTLNQYVLLKKIGKGTSGKVKLARNTLQKEMVAIKIINRPQEKTNDFTSGKSRACRRREALQREIEVMKRVQHRNLVKLYEVIDDPRCNKLYLVMQYVDNGPISVVDALGNSPKMAPDELAGYAWQIIAGLECLHRYGVVHRDIKPENILVDKKKRAFLADFGVALILDEMDSDALSRLEGTPLFLPPEVFSGNDGNASNSDVHDDVFKKNTFHGKLPFSMDVWSLGVTFYTLLVGQVPFLSVGEIRAVQQTPVVIPDTVPEAWQGLLKSMIVGNPWKRLTLAEVRTQVEQMLGNRVAQQEKSIISTWSINDSHNDVDDTDSNVELTPEFGRRTIRGSNPLKDDKPLPRGPLWCSLPKITSKLFSPMKGDGTDLPRCTSLDCSKSPSTMSTMLLPSIPNCSANTNLHFSAENWGGASHSI